MSDIYWLHCLLLFLLVWESILQLSYYLSVVISTLFCFVLIRYYYFNFKFEDKQNEADFSFLLSPSFLLFLFFSLSPSFFLYLSSSNPLSPEWQCQTRSSSVESRSVSHSLLHFVLLNFPSLTSTHFSSVQSGLVSSGFCHRPLSLLFGASWVRSSFCWGLVQRFKLDGGETCGPEGPAFVLRHRTSNLLEHTSDSAPTDPMSPREKEDTPTSGSSASHLSTAGCPSHNGVSSSKHTHTHAFIWLVQSHVAWYGSTGHSKSIPPKHTHPYINN